MVADWHSIVPNPSRKDFQYMAMCEAGSRIFSTCGKRQYFCVIVDVNGYVNSIGFNGGPSGTVHCVDGGCPRFAENSESGSSYDNCISNHAESNALLHGDYHGRVGGTLYVNGSPCFTCAKLIAGSGLARVVCYNDPLYPYSEHDKIVDRMQVWGMKVLDLTYALEEIRS